jgi:hypothetical protein
MRFQRARTVAFGLLAAAMAAIWLAPTQAEARTHRTARTQHHAQPWQGWANGGFYLNGTFYRGGNPRGSANAFNNWEGGFHPTVFLLLSQQLSG